ncbi:MAG: spore germination protein [Bacilli bacterium]|nr:spore germination protein [Bacilli bacterium]
MINIINKLKKETNNQDNIIYRKKKILYKEIYLIYNETLISSSSISDFVIRSLNKIKIPTYKSIINKISNFKYKEINNYQDISYYLNSGFTIILISKSKYLALETKKDLSRGITTPTTENTPRGALDSFTENIENNIGLIKRRIKSNDLWIKKYRIGKYTDTSIALLYINSIAKEELINKVDKLLKKINIDGIIASGVLRNLIEKENKNIFPNSISSEKPYTATKYLLQGNVIILVDNDPFCLILPTTLNDNFITEEDDYNKSINVSITRIIRYITFVITLLTPGLYIAFTTYNQEVIPVELLISIAAQRKNVPFSTFTECIFMILSFEILRESDLRLPSFASSAISIVGALILGEAAVSAGIVSPIMIIVVAITAISSLIFSEPEFTNALRIYRILFMIGATILGLYGVLLMFIIFLINLSSYNYLGMPYLSPFAPPNKNIIKDSFIKFPTFSIKKRNSLLTNNITKNVTEEPYE